MMEHYKIADKTDYQNLALELAIDHVPGFRVVPARKVLRLRHGDYGTVIGNKRGRQREWLPDRRDRDKLLAVIEETRKKHHFESDRKALEFIVARKVEWHPPTNDESSRGRETCRYAPRWSNGVDGRRLETGGRLLG
jgi:hypothetical protein